MLLLRLLLLLSEERQILPVVEVVSSLSFVRAKRKMPPPLYHMLQTDDFQISSAAEVSLQLKNRGMEAFRHKDYGDSIIINRKFTAEGSSTWKIKSKDGRVISTKRDELSKICDHMNIQIDNPLTVLTQGTFSSF